MSFVRPVLLTRSKVTLLVQPLKGTSMPILTGVGYVLQGNSFFLPPPEKPESWLGSYQIPDWNKQYQSTWLFLFHDACLQLLLSRVGNIGECPPDQLNRHLFNYFYCVPRNQFKKHLFQGNPALPFALTASL
jgi:hypothetical protein